MAMERYEMNGAPRMPVRPRLRNDARTLLRSRWVQAVLVAGTLGEALVISGGLHGGRTRPEAPRPLATVQVERAPKLTELQLGPATPASPTARTLAERYRRKGYRVSDRLARQIHSAAVDNGIDPALAFGLVRTESGFRNSATSHVGATGLTQLMPATARWLEPGTTRSDLRDSETNLRIGFRYLRGLIRRYDGDTTLALLAYNRGPGTVDRLVRRGRDPDNGYADMVRGR
jgi:soluble lytic murein transglycosylase-like protein